MTDPTITMEQAPETITQMDDLAVIEEDIENAVQIPTTEWLRRVWVCGPPLMNEQFDRAFDEFLPPDEKHEKAVANELPGILKKW